MMQKHFPELGSSPFINTIVNESMQVATKLNHVKEHGIRVFFTEWDTLIHHNGLSLTTKVLREKVLVFKEYKCSDLSKEKIMKYFNSNGTVEQV